MTPKKMMNSPVRFALVLALTLTAATAPAQVSTGVGNQKDVKRGPIQRVVDGKVTNKSDADLSGAVVYLKNSKSLAVRTFIADEQGHFHFGQLSQNTDYELYAESNGARSKSKNISSFDSRNSFNFTLKIDTAK